MHAAGAERAVAALAASQHGAFGRRQAAPVGFSRKVVAARLARGVLREPMPGVLVDSAAPVTWRQSLMVAVLASGGTASHRAAAALHRLDGFDEREVDITVAPSRHRVIPGAVVHRARLDRCEVVVVDGIPCTNIARTLCDLGAVVSKDKVEQALDHALRSGVSERWISEALERVHRPGKTGTGVLKDVLDRPDRRGPVADSMFERFVERLLAASSLPAPVRQHPVREPGGNRRARLDLAWPDVMLAVEPAGARFHGGPRRQRAAAERRKWLEALGWLVIDVYWSDLGRPEWLVDTIEDAYRRRCREVAAQRDRLGALTLDFGRSPAVES